MAASLDDLVPEVRAKAQQLLSYADSIGLSPKVTSVYRSCEQQNQLYAQGRTAPGQIVTHARGCVSWHTQRRAFDVYLGKGSTADDYQKLGDYWKSLHGTWGGDFPGFADIGHFEYHPGVHIEQVCIDPASCTTAPYPGSLNSAVGAIAADAGKAGAVAAFLALGTATAVVLVGRHYKWI